ncbi:hypothetical protein P7K49_009431 [Saguinus oedipus]|uniref:Uncharacterized protein n=1 Tax=Saguinus oedipus TaxID=9490 RepID=A0ABQ9VJY7_SAGOE|nr:hypothetical protein P7K49_009431 [Saguinus oedipus]
MIMMMLRDQVDIYEFLSSKHKTDLCCYCQQFFNSACTMGARRPLLCEKNPVKCLMRAFTCLEQPHCLATGPFMAKYGLPGILQMVSGPPQPGKPFFLNNPSLLLHSRGLCQQDLWGFQRLRTRNQAQSPL